MTTGKESGKTKVIRGHRGDMMPASPWMWNRFDEARTKSGLKNKEICAAAQCSSDRLWALKNGQMMSKQTLGALAQAVGLTFEELIGGISSGPGVRSSEGEKATESHTTEADGRKGGVRPLTLTQEDVSKCKAQTPSAEPSAIIVDTTATRRAAIKTRETWVVEENGRRAAISMDVKDGELAFDTCEVTVENREVPIIGAANLDDWRFLGIVAQEIARLNDEVVVELDLGQVGSGFGLGDK